MMKFLALALAATSASAFSVVQHPTAHPGRGAVASSSSKETTALFANGDIMQTLSTLQGPGVLWGPEGILQGHDELAVKEYDNFDFLRSMIEQSGLSNTLKSLGPYTLLAPVNSACQAFPGQMDEEILKYHILKGDIYSDELTGQMETLSGHFVTCRHEFRKIYVDDALIGQQDPSVQIMATGSKYSEYPTNVICENGVIHAINVVLTPGYKAAGAEDGPVSRRPEEYRV